jgi:hypothetical protein
MKKSRTTAVGPCRSNNTAAKRAYNDRQMAKGKSLWTLSALDANCCYAATPADAWDYLIKQLKKAVKEKSKRVFRTKSLKLLCVSGPTKAETGT